MAAAAAPLTPATRKQLIQQLQQQYSLPSHPPLQIPHNLVTQLFYKLDGRAFARLAETNLLYYMGIIGVNGVRVSVAYHGRATRISSRFSGQKGNRVTLGVMTVSQRYAKLVDVPWPA